MAKRGRTKDPDLGDPDLIPIMSIMCILIPMLIYSFVFFEVKVQEVSLPKFGQGGAGGKKGVLNLTLVVAKDKFVVKVQEDGKDREPITVDKTSFTMCNDGEEKTCECTGEEYQDYNYPELHRVIGELKTKDFQDQNTINITASDESIPWKVLARTIDAVRVRLTAKEGKDPVATFENICEYNQAKVYKIEKEDADGNKQTVPVEMFPKIVFLML